MFALATLFIFAPHTYLIQELRRRCADFHRLISATAAVRLPSAISYGSAAARVHVDSASAGGQKVGGNTLGDGQNTAHCESTTGASKTSKRHSASADDASSASGSHLADVADTSSTTEIDSIVDALLASSASARDEVAAFCRAYRCESDWFEREYRRVHIVHCATTTSQ